MATYDVYLIRHGLAAEPGTYADDQRPLTEDGRKKTRLVAKRLLDLGLRFEPILTSPLVRAHQTAEILVQAGLGDRLETVEFLAPAGAIADWLDWLLSWKPSGNATLAMVGHEPDLSRWAETLIWGEPCGALVLKKAGIIGLTLTASGSPIGNSSLFWLTPPRLFC